MRQRPQDVLAVTLQQDRDDARARELMELVELTGVHVSVGTREQLDKLAGDGVHQGVVASVRPLPELGDQDLDRVIDTAGVAPLLLILDQVQDPHNLGACLRSADAAGVAAVIVPQRRSAQMTDTVRKVACGAAETVPLLRVTNLARTLAALGERGVQRVGTSGDADASLYDLDLRGPLALVMGGEARGVRRLSAANCDVLGALPMAGGVESLNVSVATGICLFEAQRQRSCAPRSA